MSAQYPGGIYDSQIRIPEDGIDDPQTVANIYALWIFRQRFGVFQRGVGGNPMLPEISASLFSCYYRSSYANTNLCGKDWEGGQWADALWEVRRVKGADFTDRVMLYTFKRWDESASIKEDTFKEFFRNKFGRGVAVIDYLGKDREEIGSLLRSKGLYD